MNVHEIHRLLVAKELYQQQLEYVNVSQECFPFKILTILMWKAVDEIRNVASVMIVILMEFVI